SSMTPRKAGWLNATVAGIVLATFFSDVSHEMATAILPLFLAEISLGAAALGIVEGISDFLVSLSKLAGGAVGHRVERKAPGTSAGSLTTAWGTGGMAFFTSLPALIALRSIAWIARGLRGPLRDFLLSDAVDREYYGRAYGLERAGDMLGAVTG